MGSSSPTVPMVKRSRSLFFWPSHSWVTRSSSRSRSGSRADRGLYSATVTPAFLAWLMFMRILAPFLPLIS